jgi:hypothetical protein
MAEKKKLYIIASSTDTAYLEQMVNDRIREGYIPHGNLVVTQEEGVSGITYFQPMILKKPSSTA